MFGFKKNKKVVKQTTTKKTSTYSRFASSGRVSYAKPKTSVEKAPSAHSISGVKSYSKQLSSQNAKRNYISANSIRYRARFRREGIRYAQKKG